MQIIKAEYMVVIVNIWVFLFCTEETEKMEVGDWKTEEEMLFGKFNGNVQ